MRIIRQQAYQAHPVPSHAYYPPEDPLEPDITRESEIVFEIPEETEEAKYYRCRHCSELVVEYDLEDHECEDEEE